ncbi:unknown [Firmicutes bacterium CAG:791]|nr:unknown [Firmicutes bacterium CAG:791]
MPFSTFKIDSAFTASLTGAAIVSVSSRMVRDASPSVPVEAPDLIPFLPFAWRTSSPVPQRTTCEPSLHLMTAFSAVELLLASLPDSVSESLPSALLFFVLESLLPSLLASVSESVFTVPAAASMVTSVLFAQISGAVVWEERVRPSSARTTPVVPFCTFTLPSSQLPDRR